MKGTQIKDIFDHARRLESGAQEAYVRERCAGDAMLVAEVLALLRDLQAAGRFLNAGPRGPGAGAGADGAGLHEGPGNTIGRYTLLQLIGEGGFGSVFLAEQREPVRRTVALKIIKLGMDTRQVIARFEQERQALALMDHPNIARVLDAGATEAGRPYFVMELVRGEPITEYCDANKLGMRDRLEVFAQVCHAVQDAHQKGIIHRDLKPSNILVTIADDKPVPKIIDFGIAKATGPRLTDKTLFTEHRTLIGTPEYMSPEQAEMRGVDVDTRTDIYSLGVLLYELLTGMTPFDPQRLRSAAWSELQRIIREDEPPRPSTRLSAMGETVSDVAISRGTEPGRLRGLIRGDLDWIVMKCLEKPRTRRYATADELAADIHRHLTGQPVNAAPPSTVYRVRKFVRRNRTAVTAVALVTLVGLIGLAGTSTGLLIAVGQRDRARSAEGRERELNQRAQKAAAEAIEARDAAADWARRAEAVRTIIDWGLGFADPALQGGKDLTVREMLTLAEKSIASRFAGRIKEEVQARVTLGQMLLRIDEFWRADAQLRKAVEIMRGWDHPDPLLMCEARSALYATGAAGTRDYRGLSTERRLAVETAVEYLRSVNAELGAAAAEFGESATGVLARRPLDPARIARAGQSLLDVADRFAGMTRAQASALTSVLRVPCTESMSPDLAEVCAPILRRWLEKVGGLGLDDSEMLEFRHTVLKLQVNANQYGGAEALALEQLEATTRLLPADAWQRIRFDSCAAHALFGVGDVGTARRILIDVARRARKAPNVNRLAALVLARHIFEVAALMDDRALISETLGQIDPELVKMFLNTSTWSSFPDVRNQDLLRGMVDLITEQSVPDPGTRRILGATLWPNVLSAHADGGPDGPYVLQRFAEFLEPGGEPPTAMYAATQFELQDSAAALGNWQAARRAYDRGVECLPAVRGKDAQPPAEAEFRRGSCLVAVGEREKGLAVMRESLQRVRARFGPEDPVTVWLEYQMYTRLLECGERREASTLLREIVSELRVASQTALWGLWSLSSLLQMAVLQPDVDGPTLEGIRRLAHDKFAGNRIDGIALSIELAVLIRQNREREASALACEAMAASPLSRDELFTRVWGVALARGLESEAYARADEAAAKIVQPVSLDPYGRFLLGLVALRRDRFEEAFDLVSHTDAKWIEKTGRGLPDHASLRACALAHLGRWEDARAHLRDARVWARDRANVVPLIVEAEELIGEH